MQILTIIERELRVASRHGTTWWKRLAVLGLTIIVLTLVFAVMSRWSSASSLGGNLFSAAAVLMMIYAMLTGPLATADCLSRERREGTLGLLFLTPLRGVDVVLGKISAASLDHLLAMFSMLPLLAIPFLMGGVSAAQVGFTTVGVFTLMLFSLAVGAWASSLCTDSRSALGLTLGVLLALTFEPPILIELTDANIWFPGGADIPGLPCPLYTMAYCLEYSSLGGTWKFWANLSILAAMTISCLLIAITRTSQGWHEAEPSRYVRRLLHWSNVLKKPSSRSLPARRLVLDSSPVAWLESRDRLQDRLLHSILLLNAGLWAFLVTKPETADESLDLMSVWSVITQYLLCLWIAIQAPRRLIDDRLSGGLELVLCSGLSPGEYVRGAMRAWGQRFGRVVLYLLAFELLLVGTHCVAHGDIPGFLKNNAAQLWLLSMAIFPFQTYALGKVGLFEAMVRRNSIWASAHLVAKLVLLPWVLFYGGLILLETVLHRTGVRSNLNDTIAMTGWTLAQLTPIGFFLWRANERLRSHFRELASEPQNPWWRRVFRGRRFALARA